MNNPEKLLKEKDFIHEDYKKHPFSIWLWGGFLLFIACLLWGLETWYTNKLEQQVVSSPFLQVTNREMTIFLWQNPSYMRVHVNNKEGYLPGFQFIDKIGLDVQYADEYVVAPPELLFLFHTWHRLISSEFSQRKIPADEFIAFLNYCEEWQPRNWPAAPPEYSDFFYGKPLSQIEDLAKLSEKTLPLIVRQAFQGWKNYFKEGAEINRVKPTFIEMQNFLTSHPHYTRSYWRNIVNIFHPKYLIEMRSNSNLVVPNEEMAPFLKVAFYNYQQGLKGL
jgi:hypothetical protein